MVQAEGELCASTSARTPSMGTGSRGEGHSRSSPANPEVIGWVGETPGERTDTQAG
jgi:hypothetical protein